MASNPAEGTHRPFELLLAKREVLHRSFTYGQKSDPHYNETRPLMGVHCG